MSVAVSEPILDVVGIGNALVDVLSHENEAFIEQMALIAGRHDPHRRRPGRRAVRGNGAGHRDVRRLRRQHVAGIASFGGRAGYIGKVRDDQLGEVFGHDLRSTGVHFSGSAAADGRPTGRCLIVVTPDAERTMNTYLGASANLGPDDIDTELVGAARVTFLEGYLFDLPRCQGGLPRRQPTRLTPQDARCRSPCPTRSASSVTAPSGSNSSRDQVDILFANERRD